MSNRAIAFVRRWTFENVNAGPYDPGDAVVTNLVEQLLEDAKSENITQEEIEEAAGPVRDIVSGALEQATDNEVERLAAKDD